MKRIFALILAALMTASLLAACDKGESPEASDPVKTTAQTDSSDESESEDPFEQAQAYKEEGKYDEAIDAFLAVIEKDDSNYLSYLELADLYIRKNEFQNAYDILNVGRELVDEDYVGAFDSKLLDFNSANMIKDSSGVLHGKSHFEDGVIVWYHVYTFETDRFVGVAQYDANDTQIASIAFTYNDNGQPLTSYAYYTDGVIEKVEFSYNDAGQLAETKEYAADGSLAGYSVNEFDENGYKIKETRYHADGSEHWCLAYTHDVEGLSTEMVISFYGKQVGTSSKSFNEYGYANGASSRFKGVYDRTIDYDFNYQGFHVREEQINESGYVRYVCYNTELSKLY